jgi:hypothetical protein
MGENSNMSFYEKLQKVPDEAKKKIDSGRIKGMTDINPMWRIKIMTEIFGMCGIGWKYEITKQWNEACGQVVKTYCNINLYVKVDGEWSDAIPGTGGSSFAAIEKQGMYVSDENYKMALTDALSVAMKALGVGADVYWEKGADETKYGNYITQDKNRVNADELTPQETIEKIIKPKIAQANTRDELVNLYNANKKLENVPGYKSAFTARKKALGIQ